MNYIETGFEVSNVIPGLTRNPGAVPVETGNHDRILDAPVSYTGQASQVRHDIQKEHP